MHCCCPPRDTYHQESTANLIPPSQSCFHYHPSQHYPHCNHQHPSSFYQLTPPSHQSSISSCHHATSYHHHAPSYHYPGTSPFHHPPQSYHPASSFLHDPRCISSLDPKNSRGFEREHSEYFECDRSSSGKRKDDIAVYDISSSTESDSSVEADDDIKKETSENETPKRHLRPRKNVKIAETASDKDVEENEFYECYQCKQPCEYYCPSHSLWLKTKDAPQGAPYWTAKKSTPKELDIKLSGIPKAGLGIWARVSLPQGTLMGPFIGTIHHKCPVDKTYVWKMPPSHAQCARSTSEVRYVLKNTVKRKLGQLVGFVRTTTCLVFHSEEFKLYNHNIH
ncbi:Uncharacterized protein GBIM_10067, partial [Gryllus bimaculatus]